MKFIHLSDVHLGIVPDKNKSWSQDRYQEIYDTFKIVIESAIDQKVDLVLIAGDLFHGQPLLKELKEINYLFEKIAPVQVVIIAGNHDYVKDNSFYNSFKWSKNVHFILNDQIECVEIPELNTNIYGMSYHSREIKFPIYDNVIPANRNRINILLGHGGDVNHIIVDENKFIENGFDYSAFGHIHKGYINRAKHFAYSGSLEPTDKNDYGEKGYIIGNIDFKSKKLDLDFVPCAQRQYVTLKINCNNSVTNHALVEKIVDKISEFGSNHIYKVVLTGARHESMEFEVENSLKDYNICEIIDETHIDYDYGKLLTQNDGTIVGQVIQKLQGIDDAAMFYAVNALLRTKR